MTIPQPSSTMITRVTAPTFLVLIAAVGALPGALIARPVARPGAPPVIPVGLDAYRMWDRWSYQRIGERAYMRSTYDRSGGNEGADASHFLYQLADDNNVSLDVAGQGVLYFVRTNHWHGSPWRYNVDGKEHVVSETSTADPNHPAQGSKFVPSAVFAAPLAVTWADTKGSDLSWLPIPFLKSLQLGYSRTHYGTGYYIYHQFAPGTPLSHPLRSWAANSPPPLDVLNLVARGASAALAESRPLAAAVHGLDQARVEGSPSRFRGPLVLQRSVSVPAQLRSIEISAPVEEARELGRAGIRITWDDRSTPSVDAPLALFFGAGTLYNRDNHEFLVKAFPVHIQFTRTRVLLSCWFPMPFRRSFRIEIGQTVQPLADCEINVRYEPLPVRFEQAGYFHATYCDVPHPVRGQDMVLLDTRGAEGSQEWTGSFIGMSWIFSHEADLGTLEGDPRFFFDDSQTPQAQGTGTEEFGGGGDYWGGQNMTLPLAGHPCGARNAKSAVSAEDRIESAYRFLLADLFPFGKNARIQLEHGGTNESTQHYESVCYWYGLPGSSLVKTDSLQIGNLADEAVHAYSSPHCSVPYSITSRYELGVDHLGSTEIYPATVDTGRTTTGRSEFTITIRPDNYGALLRRKLDYQFPNQRADVYVADVGLHATAVRSGRWRKAGTWYTAGSNTCVYSNPRDELGATQHIAQTSNRRFRDDEFLIGRALTRGRSRIRVRIVFTPVRVPLFPGRPRDPLAWSEIRYDAYCFVMPGA